MVLPLTPDAPCRITSARDDALTAVAQTACVAMALRALDLQVGALAATVYERREDAIAVCTRETALNRRQRRKRILNGVRRWSIGGRVSCRGGAAGAARRQ